ncbi:pentatricopeptide repeat-containing protein At5g04810, chloroplastic-like [Diospyros lotus]|uniref:pentatricopeptide repeat-containing protein At5g04810, chloroplastic-like n=1 Tax=Diospyros lotus TaxID=55363 RepID=UPI00224DE0DF|nr:pentatricopeptide repeat-containing protein At5g04810, chloroplastic-like [Diospyros lotus]
MKGTAIGEGKGVDLGSTKGTTIGKGKGWGRLTADGKRKGVEGGCDTDDDREGSNSSSPSLTTKLRLTSKLSLPPPAPSPPSFPPEERGNRISGNSVTNEPPGVEFWKQGKIFVGNLPLWIKKHELAEFFRQFGPIKNVILIKGHNETERNMGFGFVIYDGATAEKAAMKAVEFDGVEFDGRVLTVKLDDGRRMKERFERQRWVEGADWQRK